MKPLSGAALFLFAITFSSVALADEEHNVNAHRRWDGEALKVIEERCLVCHNRQRIEAAVEERKEMERIQESMEQKGAVLTEQDREVLGHFWGQDPFKGKKDQPPAPKEWR